MPDESEEYSAESNLSFAIRIIRSILFIDILLFSGTGLVCYFSNRRTLDDFFNGLFIAGFSVLALVYLTGKSAPREVRYLAFKTLLNAGSSPQVSYEMVFAGLIAILVSILAGVFG